MKAKLSKRKCKECGITFQKTRPLQFVCSPKCAINYNRKQKEKKENKEWKIEKKKRINKLKTYSQKVNDARLIFQKWVRLRDGDDPCISSGRTYSEIWNGGHFFKAELCSGVIFDPDNCHKQSSKDNLFLQGNVGEYKPRLIAKIGQDRFDRLEAKANETRQYVWTDQRLEAVKRLYRYLIKKMRYEND